jgi:hypothetical protein
VGKIVNYYEKYRVIMLIDDDKLNGFYAKNKEPTSNFLDFNNSLLVVGKEEIEKRMTNGINEN